MKRPSLNACICLFIPVTVLTVIGLLTPGSGVGMIFLGVATVIGQIVGALATFLWMALGWSLPLVAAGMAYVFIFKIKTINKKADMTDHLCGLVAAAFALLLIWHQGTIGSVAILVASAVGWVCAQSFKTQDEECITFAFTMFSMMLFVFIIAGHIARDGHQEMNEILAEKAVISNLYQTQTSEAFARDDAHIIPLIEKDARQMLTGMWLLHKAPSAESFPHSDGSEIINTSGVGIDGFRCLDGRLIEPKGLSYISEALARRACVKRAGLVN